MISFGVDLGLRHERDADKFILSVGEGSFLASTHLVAGVGQRHVAVAFTGGKELEAGLLTVLAEHEHWCLVVEEHETAVMKDEEPVPAERAPVVPVVEVPAAGERVLGPREEFLVGAREALAEHGARRSGRVVRFEGVQALVGEVSVAEVLATAIDRVAVLADQDPAAETVLVTRQFVRPRWLGGQLVLHTQL